MQDKIDHEDKIPANFLKTSFPECLEDFEPPVMLTSGQRSTLEAIMNGFGRAAPYNPTLLLYLKPVGIFPALNEKLESASFNTKENHQDDVNGGITAILPAYNEEVSIGSVVLHVKKYVCRVIVIDDGSNDRTAELAELAGAEVIRHTANKGKGAALKTGFMEASGNGTKVIVTIDSDGQHNPSEIPKLVAPILAGEADIVNGSRYMNGNGKNTPFYRRVGQNILDKITNLNSGLKMTDTQSGFRAFAANTVDAFGFKSNGFTIESEMLADAAKAGMRVKEVEIGVRYDVGCSTEHPVSHGLRVLVKVLEDMELNRPLYYFTAPGLVFFVVGLGMGLTFLRNFYLGGSLNFGPTLLMIVLTLVGTFMVFNGIILHSMSRLIQESRKKGEQVSKKCI